MDLIIESPKRQVESTIQEIPNSIGYTNLRPFFGFYGGKWRDSIKHYPPPIHDTIIEPFAGSAGYSVRFADRKIILCDLDPVIASVWEYLIKVTPNEILAIPDVPLNGSVKDLNLIEEAEWLVGFWLNRGTSSPRKTPSKWMREGIRKGSFWGQRVRERIATQVGSIRHWKVYNCSYENLPITGPATWFIDPPYQTAGKYYVHGSKDIEFKELGGWCRNRTGQVIVCENKGADWLDFDELADVKTTRASIRSKEMVWINNT